MNGVLYIDKPPGYTSFDVVAVVRRLSGTRRVGHAGTLDPMATGVLPVFLGYPTRFIDLLPNHDKAYTARFELGYTTDTLDSTGETLTRSPVNAGLSDIRALMPRFTGEILQIPPMVSAVKRDGVPLYKLARAGRTVERAPRPVRIDALEVSPGGEEHTYILNVACARGVYVRALIDDLGNALGCGAVMTALRRTMACGISEEDCAPLDAVRARGVSAFLKPPDALLRDYPAARVSAEELKRLRNGVTLSPFRLRDMAEHPAGLCRIYSNSDFCGLAFYDARARTMRARVMLPPEETTHGEG